jgi:CubicO group peptidase (beta-lactamase class C family)
MIRHSTTIAGRAGRLAAGAAAIAFVLARPLAAQSPRIPSRAAPTFASIGSYLSAEVDSGAFPSAVLLVGSHDSIVDLQAIGHYGDEDPRPVADTTVYDMASLTKVIGLTTAAMILVSEGKLDLDRPVHDYLPAFSGPEKDRVLIRHLLTHSSGLPADRPLYLETSTRRQALALVDSTPLDTVPGARFVYSDLGAIVLMQVIEKITGEPLNVYLQQHVFGPLGMTRTRYLPPASWIPFIAPTEHDPWRGRELRGEVHDENAARLGGVSGHAGLFSNAPDLARFAFFLLDAWHDRLPADAPLKIPSRVVRMFTTRQNLPPGSSRALGWDTSDHDGGSSGHLLSNVAFGHTGFTGTSIWIDPATDLVIILLTNRVNPTRFNHAILHIRSQVADRVVEALGDAGTR